MLTLTEPSQTQGPATGGTKSLRGGKTAGWAVRFSRLARLGLPAAAVWLLGSCSAPSSESSGVIAAPPPIVSTETHPRFSAMDLGLTESDDRDRWQRVDEILDDLKIADGFVVADIAAGGGWFAERIARRVGPAGRVYAEEIQETMIQAISRRIEVERLFNITPVLGTPEDPQLPSGALDCAVIINSFHDIDAPVRLLASVRSALKPSGLLGVVDFTPGGGGPGPKAEERVAPETIIEAATAANLRLVARFVVPPFAFLLVFEK
jgi:ubiquinone/menaquinone biosynthesis C-methylase UbiE